MRVLKLKGHQLTLIIVLVVFLLATGVRMAGLGSFMTVDEPRWMLRSSEFWYKLGQLDFPGTFLTTHPGATTMWLAGFGMTVREGQLGVGLDEDNTALFQVAAAAPLALATGVLIGLVTWFLIPLFGASAAVVTGVLLALDPFLLGLSQIVHLDALLGYLMLLAVVALLNHDREPRLRWLTVAGLALGGALATKILPSLWVFVFALLLLGVRHLVRTKRDWHGLVRDFAYFSGLALLMLVVLWPALWSKHDNLDWYIQREFTSVVAQEHVALEEVEQPIEPSSFYARTVLSRTTPLQQVALLAWLGIAGLTLARRSRLTVSRKEQLRLTYWLMLYAIGFLVLITFVPKRADRYATAALVTLPLIAGWVITYGYARWRSRGLAPLRRGFVAPQRGFTIGVATAIIGLLIVLPGALSSHSLAYANPLFVNLRPQSQQGWGEGLEQAATWLNKHPLGEDLLVASWYPSVLRRYFNGGTFSLSSRDDPRIAYVVTYRNMAGRESYSQASVVLAEYQEREPAQVVEVNGQPYVWIYEVLNPQHFEQHVGEIVRGVEVGQTVRPRRDDWQTIDIGFATFSSRQNTATVVLHIRDTVEATEDLRTVTLKASQIVDNEWQRFTFDPIPDSADREFYMAITSPEAAQGQAVTVRFSNHDLKPGRMLLLRRELTTRERRADFFRSGDIAYRL